MPPLQKSRQHSPIPLSDPYRTSHEIVITTILGLLLILFGKFPSSPSLSSPLLSKTKTKTFKPPPIPFPSKLTPQDAEAASKSAASREEEIASGNPLLNLQAALGGATPATPSTPGGPAGFTVKRRWDDDLIFKNQAAGEALGGQAGKGEFVNDLLRSDFHRKFMHR